MAKTKKLEDYELNLIIQHHKQILKDNMWGLTKYPKEYYEERIKYLKR